MGQVDTVLKYGPYNTYKMDAGETLYADPCDVSVYSKLTIQLVSIRIAGVTTAQIGLRWIDAQNKKTGTDQLITFDVATTFTEWWTTVNVPSAAKSLQWWIKATSGGFNWGCGKVGPGTMPTAFSDNFRERSSLLTARGLYTGSVEAQQVLVTDELDLGMKLTMIEAGQINLSDQTTGQIAGMSLTASALTFTTTGAYRRMSGASGDDFLQAGASESSLNFRVANDGKMFATAAEITGKLTSSEIILLAGDKTVELGALGMTSYFASSHGLIWKKAAAIYGAATAFDSGLAKGLAFSSGDALGVLQTDPDGMTISWTDTNGTFGLDMHKNSLGDTSCSLRGIAAYIGSATQGLGVDATGPYRVKNNIKTYF